MDVDTPDVPTRSHRSSQRRSMHAANHAAADKYSRRNSGAASSPDIINNLISSLSIISEPASSHFDSHPSASSPYSSTPLRHNSTHPTSSSAARASAAAAGSFGVDYGAFSKSLDPPTQTTVDLDEVAASAPVVRTSKTPTRTAKSPRSSSRDSGSAIRAYLRSANNSRPTSPASTGSRNDDTHSIGNLSIERGSGPAHELRPRRSHDSWGKKISRNSKGLMYMSSKERLRDRADPDRKWTQSASMPLNFGASSVSGSRGDSVLAETTIREEPRLAGDAPLGEYEPEYTQTVPSRSSSLRGHRKQRSSARHSARNSEDPIRGPILEADEISRSPTSPSYIHARSDSDTARRLFNVDERIASVRALSEELYGSVDEAERQRRYVEDLDEEGAPFPAISNGRRRWERSQDRSSGRLSASGRLSPNLGDDPASRRSSSKFKRLSGQLGPRSEPRTREPSAERRPLPAGYERPDSADSVDGAVESYLCSPRLSQRIKHPQTGRVISFSEVGDPEGSAVFCCVGMGLTRYITAFYDELALTLKLRLITPDRPGVGDSESYSDGATTPLSWPDDVYAICQALKITKFSILAHSAGAIYALATALRMPQHIRGKIHLLAPWIPPSQMNVFGSAQTEPPTHAIPTSQRILRALPTPLLKAANSSFMNATSASLTSSLPKNQRRGKRKSSGHQSSKATDKENPDNFNGQLNGNRFDNGEASLQAPNATENMDRMHPPQGPMNGDSGIVGETEADKERQQVYDVRLTHAIWELATTGANPAVDLLVCLERRHAIGFRYVDITRPVVIHHGSKDNRVPVDNIKWLGKAMRRCEVRVLEGEGHGLMASAVVMGSVLMEMSKEWEDWMRVTGADGRKERERERGRKVR